VEKGEEEEEVLGLKNQISVSIYNTHALAIHAGCSHTTLHDVPRVRIVVVTCSSATNVCLTNGQRGDEQATGVV
jgi:hypothetical protein